MGALVLSAWNKQAVGNAGAEDVELEESDQVICGKGKDDSFCKCFISRRGVRSRVLMRYEWGSNTAKDTGC